MSNTIYQSLAEAKKNVTLKRYFKGEEEQLSSVCNQLEELAAQNDGELPKEFKLYMQEGELLYKVKEFFEQKLGVKIKTLLIGQREKTGQSVFEVTLK